MNILLWSVLAVLALGMGSVAQADSRVIGHRGLGANHSPEPENSVVALATALKDGAGAVEFDVQLSSDGELVLAHDVILDRMTNGKGCVASHDLASLRRLTLRDGNGVERAPYTVDTFHEALNTITPFDNPGREFLANIHIKVYDGVRGDWGGLFNHHCPVTKYAELTRKILDELRLRGLMGRVLLTSFDPRVIDLIRKLEPKAHVGMIALFETHTAVRRAIRMHYDAVALDYQNLSRGEVKQAHRHKIKVYGWSPSNEAVMEKLFAAYQIDGVIADSLPNALQACEKACYSSSHE